MSAHTPGPWTVRGQGFVVGGEGDALNADYVALTLITAPSVPSNHQPDAEEARANAHLMAAAPELFAALKLLLTTHDASCVDAEACQIGGIDLARAAIAKAEGR